MHNDQKTANDPHAVGFAWMPEDESPRPAPTNTSHFLAFEVAVEKPNCTRQKLDGDHTTSRNSGARRRS
jgi:hypothetical protein